MRILILCHEFAPERAGGAQGVGFLAEELARDHEIDVITKEWKGLPRREGRGRLAIYRVPSWGLAPHGLATFSSVFFYSGFAASLAAAFLIRRRYDAIHGHFGVPSGALAVMLGRLFRVPSVVTLAGAEVYDPPRSDEILKVPFAKALVRWTVERAGAVVALSHTIVQHLKNDFGVRRSAAVIAYGIPRRDGVERAFAENRGRSAAAVHFLCVARLVSRKRHCDLLKALSFVPRDLDLQLDLVGDGSEKAELERRAREWGVRDRVTFRGEMTEAQKWDCYREADAFILVSTHECQGLVYAEAMQAGLPVIAGTNGGQRDFIEDGKNGLLVPVGDIRAIARAMEQLARDPGLRSRMGRSARKSADTLSVEKSAAEYLKVYEAALKGSSSPESSRENLLVP